jgi:antitoxin component of RelBE/YafQ-DinJ toxin-antitoxin module
MARKEVIQIRCSEIEKDSWKGVANSQNLELSAWIRLVLDKATRVSEARTAINAAPQDDE